MMTIAHGSKERAREMGMERNGQTMSGWSLSSRQGQVKELSHVSLEIGEGKKLLVGYAPLREKRSSSGSVVVRFMANRAYRTTAPPLCEVTLARTLSTAPPAAQ